MNQNTFCPVKYDILTDQVEEALKISREAYGDEWSGAENDIDRHIEF